MSKIKIVVFDRDLLYAKVLAERLQELGTTRFETILFSEYSGTVDYLKVNSEGVLLIHETLYQNELQNVCHHIILLTETEQETSLKSKIYKYQPVSRILMQLEAYFITHVGEKERAETPAKIITFFSYVDHSINSFLAYSLGCLYAKSKKTLLVNLEALPYEPQHDSVSFNLSDLIYHLNTREEEIPQLEEYLYRVQGLDCLAPIKYYRDLYEIKKEDMERFLTYLGSQTQYEVILIVTDFIFTYIMELLEASTQIYVHTGRDFISTKKESAFASMLQYERKEHLYEKMKPVAVPEQILSQLKEGEEIAWESYEPLMRPLLID